MRFMMMHSDKKSEAGILPSKELMAEMGKLMEGMAKSGVLLAGEGVHPSAKGARLKFSGGQRTVTDGPFTEAKEVIAGFVIVDVQSKEEAIEWATRFANVVGDVDIEIRQVCEPPESANDATPDKGEDVK